MTTYKTAKDEMFAIINAANNAASAELKAQLYWQGVMYTTAPDKTKIYAKVSRQEVLGMQTGLGAEAVEGQRTRHTNDGLIFVQLFGPETDGKTSERLGSIAEAFKNALRKHKGNVTIRNARINDLPSENSQYRLNVVAEYQYDELA